MLVWFAQKSISVLAQMPRPTPYMAPPNSIYAPYTMFVLLEISAEINLILKSCTLCKLIPLSYYVPTQNTCKSLLHHNYIINSVWASLAIQHCSPLTQAPTYHIALEAILVTWILYLLFFSKQYRPESKHDKLTKEVICDDQTFHCLQ